MVGRHKGKETWRPKQKSTDKECRSDRSPLSHSLQVEGGLGGLEDVPTFPKSKVKQKVWKWVGGVFLPDLGERWLSPVFGALWSLLGLEDLLLALSILGAGLLSWFIFCFEPAGGSWRETLVFQLHLPSFGCDAGVMMWRSVNQESWGLVLAFLSGQPFL